MVVMLVMIMFLVVVMILVIMLMLIMMVMVMIAMIMMITLHSIHHHILHRLYRTLHLNRMFQSRLHTQRVRRTRHHLASFLHPHSQTRTGGARKLPPLPPTHRSPAVTPASASEAPAAIGE